eukprot:g60800.t1
MMSQPDSTEVQWFLRNKGLPRISSFCDKTKSMIWDQGTSRRSFATLQSGSSTNRMRRFHRYTRVLSQKEIPKDQRLKLSSRELVQRANQKIKTTPVSEAFRLWSAKAEKTVNVQFVDIRDIRELQRTGKIPGAFHAPRGMLEFWVDPESPYAKEVFQQKDTEFVFYCQSAWRSALSTAQLQDMGFAPVSHLEGGFSAWQKAGHPIEAVEAKHKNSPS